MVTLQARIAAPPSSGTRRDDQSTFWRTAVIIGGEVYTLYSDDDPTASLNGERAKLAKGEVVDVGAVFRLYPRRSGVGVAFEGFESLKG